MRNGRLATITWFTVLAANVGLSVAHINAPYMNQILTAMTGVWIGNLTLAAKRKSDDDDETADD